MLTAIPNTEASTCVLNIVQNRITRALRVEYDTSINAQKRRPEGRRRGSYKKGVVKFSASVNTRISEALKERLDAVCKALQVERGVVVRDALETYLAIAEQEGLGASRCPTTLRHRT